MSHSWKNVRIVLGVVILIASIVALLMTFVLPTESAPQQTVQELRYVKWLIILLFGLWLTFKD